MHVCGAPQNAYCGDVMVIYGDPGCALQGPQIPISGSCINASTPVGSVIWNPTSSAGQCPPTAGTPTGTATPAEPTTACCLPAP
jgi:hypothetical protein